jgi:hypothetical protein
MCHSNVFLCCPKFHNVFVSNREFFPDSYNTSSQGCWVYGKFAYLCKSSSNFHCNPRWHVAQFLELTTFNISFYP